MFSGSILILIAHWNFRWKLKSNLRPLLVQCEPGLQVVEKIWLEVSEVFGLKLVEAATQPKQGREHKIPLNLFQNHFHSLTLQIVTDNHVSFFLCRISKLFDEENMDQCLLGQANTLMRFFHEHLSMSSKEQTAQYKVIGINILFPRMPKQKKLDMFDTLLSYIKIVMYMQTLCCSCMILVKTVK